MNTKDKLVKGIIELPEQFYELVDDSPILMENMFITIWHNFLVGKGTSTIYWASQFKDINTFNKFVYHLSEAGWIESIVYGNWAVLKFRKDKLLRWLDHDEIDFLVYSHKYDKYKMTKMESMNADLVKSPLGIIKSGIVRKGFQKAGNHEFKYDYEKLVEYIDPITKNLVDNIENLDLDNVSYVDVATTLLDGYIIQDEVMTMGSNVCDSRGRAIHKCTQKVFNPIASKDARALVELEPQGLTEEALDQVYMTIASILGCVGKTDADTVRNGYLMYKQNRLPELDLQKKSDRGKLHERIMLERIYANIDAYDGFNWVVGIEIDAKNSALQIIGTLLDYKPYLDGTSLTGDATQDLWRIDGLSREHVKRVVVPFVYGSNKSIEELWKNNNLLFTDEMVAIMQHHLDNGVFQVSKEFKDFINENAVPSEVMDITVWGESYKVHCNKYKKVENKASKYKIYTSSGKFKEIVHIEEHRVPNLKAYKRSFLVNLIHHLDSRIADYVCSSTPEVVLPIHDAFICHPNTVVDVKDAYTSHIDKIYNDRHDILKVYCESIGIDSELYEFHDDKCSDFEAKPTCLK